MITTILWDVDATLLDFLAAEKAAIKKLFQEFDLGECTDEMIRRYSKINRSYWERLECGELTKPEVLVGRFREFFETEGICSDVAEVFNERYQLCLGDTIVFRDDSYEIVKSAGKSETICGFKRNSRCSGEKTASFRSGRIDGQHLFVRGPRRGKTKRGVF